MGYWNDWQKILKLPEKYTKSLIDFMNVKDKTNFEKYKIFDYRLNNQLILKWRNE